MNERTPSSRLSRGVKRTADIVLASAGLLVIWPLLLAIAVAVKLSSSGPVFYRGLRTGLEGRPFYIYKFRSMIVDGELKGGTTTGQDDPRLTRIGKFIRKYKLDELPQLFNVLLGNMSFVGPRPEVPEYTDQYTEQERKILSVRPGITDLASLEFSDLQSIVGGDDPDAAYRERVLPIKNALRLRYVEEQSLTGDTRILFRTLWTVLSKPARKSA